MHDIGDMNFFSFLTFIGNQRFGSKGYFNWNILKGKVSIGYINDKRQLLVTNMSLDYYRFFSHKLVWFGIIWVLIPKIDVWGIFPTQLLSENTNFQSKLKNVNKHGILKFTLLLIKLEHKVFLNSMVLTKSRNWSQIPTQWWKLSGKNAP